MLLHGHHGLSKYKNLLKAKNANLPVYAYVEDTLLSISTYNGIRFDLMENLGIKDK